MMHSHQRNVQRDGSTGGVLILVVMDDALALPSNTERVLTAVVLILVVMDDALAPIFKCFVG